MLYSKEDVVRASGLQMGSSSLAISDWMVARRIRSELPGISSASVRLAIPDTLQIKVSETPALAILETDSGIVMLSRECHVVSGYSGSEAELIHIRGIRPESAEVGKLLGVSAGESTKLSYLQEFLPALEKEGLLDSVQDIDISNGSDLHFQYLGRFTVRMGSQEKLLSKLDLMRRIVSTLSIGDNGILDLSTEHEGHYIPG